MKKVSAVIVSWKRPEEVGKIIENLHQYEFIDEIIVVINRPDDNRKCYRRWETALGAKNETIYAQDDDCIVENLRELYEEYHANKMVIGIKGKRIQEFYNQKSGIIGWGSFFEKSWIDFSKYIKKYGENDLLIRESDRIITHKIAVDKGGHNYRVADIVDFPSAGGEMAMYLQPEHWDTKAEAIKRAKEIYG